MSIRTPLRNFVHHCDGRGVSRNRLILLLFSIFTAFSGFQLWSSFVASLDGTVNVRKSSRNHLSDIAPALKCLGYASDVVTFQHFNITIKYPKDPFDHFQEIHEKLSRWNLSHIPPHSGPQYQGPWIEDHWQQHFLSKAESLSNTNFSSVFGPYIPLLAAWTDIWVAGNYKYDDYELIKTLKEALRPTVLYITVSQNDDGFPGDNADFQQLQDAYNILVLSAGGYGHVPLPLLKQREEVLPKIPFNNRTHLVSYVGSREHSPRDMRFKMLDVVGYEHYFYGDGWRSVMQDSKFSLCPRGFGRTSYHVMETLQMGLIPIQVYLEEDIPWLPYAATILENISFATTVENLPALLTQLEQLSDNEIMRMEREIEGLISDYFTFEGVMKQIEQFMVNPEQSALVCQALPAHAGSNRKKYFS